MLKISEVRELCKNSKKDYGLLLEMEYQSHTLIPQLLDIVERQHKVLRTIEYSFCEGKDEIQGWVWSCPICHEMLTHKPDCALAEVLNLVEEEKK